MRRVVLLALGCAALAWAKPPSEKDMRHKLDSTRSKIRLSRAQLKEANEQEQDLATQLGVTENQLTDFAERLREVRTELSLSRSRHEMIRQSVLESRDKLKSKQRALGARLRELESEGSASYLQVLLRSQSWTQLLTRDEDLARVVDSERQLIAGVRREREILELRRAAAQQTVNEIRRLEVDFRTQVSELSEVQEKQALLLARLQVHRQRLQRYVVGLEHISADMESKLQARIRERSKSVVGYVPVGSGKFRWPLPLQGIITSPFGYRVHPITGATRFHSGLDIAVDQGTQIAAADNGIVIVAEWYGGYGNCVIVQHGQDLSTLYGHCLQLYVKNGDVVRQGQVIALVGSTGMSTGPHLHFEVRQAGTPVDPRSYL